MRKTPSALIILALALASVGIFFLLRHGGSDKIGENLPQLVSTPGLPLANDLLWGAPNRDQFPSVDSPRYVDRAVADTFLRDEDRVYLIKKGDSCLAFPEVLLSTYHVVNDVIDGEPVAITFCLLAGSVCRFSRRVGDQVLTFGLTGQLYGGNSVLYDKETGTNWLQMNGEPLQGPLYGKARLQSEPLECSSWGRIKGDPNVKVLAPQNDMGEYRTFQHDIEAEKLGQRVVESSRRKMDPRLLPYTKGLGIRVQGVERFYPKEVILKRRIINDTVGGWSVVIYKGADGATRVFRRVHDGRRLEFSLIDGVLEDHETGSKWSDDGLCTSGPLVGARLEVPFFTRVYWFAWSSVYPETELA